MACPDELQPLTKTRGQVVSTIAKLRHWNGSGTNNYEGFMWGWRVLSPTIPFTEGEPYDKSKKILVLMSDGLADSLDNPNGALSSDPHSLGYRRTWQENGAWGSIPSDIRLPLKSRANYRTYMNDRLKLACTNAKAAGIEVYTVLFRETDAATVKALEQCATNPDMAFRAKTKGDLVAVFSAVANDIAKLRLTK
jgi:hypothetical protein